MDDIIRKSRVQAIEDSLILLDQQAKRLEDAYANGERRWAHGSIKDSLINTGKAMVLDAGKLQDLEGANEWNEAKKQRGLQIVRGNEH